MTHPADRSARRALARKFRASNSRNSFSYCQKRWRLIYLRRNKLVRAQKTGKLWPHPKQKWTRLLSETFPLNVLFVCSRNKWRSPTGEAVFRKVPGVAVRSAGTSRSARRTITLGDIQWADLIFVMEEKHGSRLRADFRRPLQHKTIHVLDIPDEYQFMDTQLIELLKTGAGPIIEKALHD